MSYVKKEIKVIILSSGLSPADLLALLGDVLGHFAPVVLLLVTSVSLQRCEASD